MKAYSKEFVDYMNNDQRHKTNQRFYLIWFNHSKNKPIRHWIFFFGGGGNNWVTVTHCVANSDEWFNLFNGDSSVMVIWFCVNESYRKMVRRNIAKKMCPIKLWREREDQQHETVRCLLSILSQHVSGIIIPIFRRTRRVLLHVLCCACSAGCGW